MLSPLCEVKRHLCSSKNSRYSHLFRELMILLSLLRTRDTPICALQKPWYLIMLQTDNLVCIQITLFLKLSHDIIQQTQSVWFCSTQWLSFFPMPNSWIHLSLQGTVLTLLLTRSLHLLLSLTLSTMDLYSYFSVAFLSCSSSSSLLHEFNFGSCSITTIHDLIVPITCNDFSNEIHTTPHHYLLFNLNTPTSISQYLHLQIGLVILPLPPHKVRTNEYVFYPVMPSLASSDSTAAFIFRQVQ